MKSKHFLHLLACLVAGLMLVGPAMAWSNGPIAFTSGRDGDREIYTMPATGETGGVTATKLTDNAGIDDRPAFSPDGTKIAFVSDRDGDYEIYVMDSTGANQKRITYNTAEDSSPTWSSDSGNIAFVSDRDGSDEIYRVSASGEINDAPAYRLTYAGGSNPAWSPDGTKIAFESDRNGNDEIYVMSRDNENNYAATRLTSAGGGSPAWSPDGTKIVFESTRDATIDDPDLTEIYVMPSAGELASGASATRLTVNEDVREECAVWSPDGKKIAFHAGVEMGFMPEIFVMDADGTNQIQLTFSPRPEFWLDEKALDIDPSWGVAAFPRRPLRVTAITPSEGNVESTAKVTINGAGFVPGATVMLTYAAPSGWVHQISAESVIVDSSRTITCTFVLPPMTVVPPDWNVVVTNPDGGSSSLVGGFTVYPPLSVTSIVPGSGTPGSTAPAVITGTGFREGATVDLVSPGISLPRQRPIRVTNVVVTSSTAISCRVTLPRGVAAGAYDVIVTNIGGPSARLRGGFTI